MAKETQKSVEQKIAQELESLMDDSSVLVSEPNNSMAPMGLSENGLGDKLQHPNTIPTDFHKLKKSASSDARKTLKSLMDFYLGAKIIKKNEYVKYKKKVDEMGLSNLMFAIEASQYAIIKLLEDIDMGNTHPRNFEAMATLNGQMMNMIKHQQALFVTMEEGYKKIKHDHEDAEHQAEKTEDVSHEDVTIIDGTYKTRGTKLLMANMQKKIKENPTEAPSSAGRLTNPHNRPENTIKGAPKKRTSEDEESDELYGDLGEHF